MSHHSYSRLFARLATASMNRLTKAQHDATDQLPMLVEIDTEAGGDRMDIAAKRYAALISIGMLGIMRAFPPDTAVDSKSLAREEEDLFNEKESGISVIAEALEAIDYAQQRSEDIQASRPSKKHGRKKR